MFYGILTYSSIFEHISINSKLKYVRLKFENIRDTKTSQNSKKYAGIIYARIIFPRLGNLEF